MQTNAFVKAKLKTVILNVLDTWFTICLNCSSKDYVMASCKLIPISLNRFGMTKLEKTLIYPASVRYKDTFLLVGGKCDVCDPVVFYDTILEYQPDDETFTTSTERLRTARALHAAVLVGSDIVDCRSK